MAGPLGQLRNRSHGQRAVHKEEVLIFLGEVLLGRALGDLEMNLEVAHVVGVAVGVEQPGRDLHASKLAVVLARPPDAKALDDELVETMVLNAMPRCRCASGGRPETCPCQLEYLDDRVEVRDKADIVLVLPGSV